MATIPSAVPEAPAGPTNKAPVFSLVIAIVFGVIVSVAVVGGAGYYLIHSGKLRLQMMPSPKPTVEAKTHTVALDPLLVNLSDSSGAAYLRVSIALRVADAEVAPKEEKESGNAKEQTAALRDAALVVLARETSERLLTPDGKEHLRTELKQSLAERVPDFKVVDLYFTEFLVQR